MAMNPCIMCLRLRAVRLRRHVLGADIPVNRPWIAEYIRENALVEEVCPYLFT